MDQVKIFRALGNETRLNILLWLKNPVANFEPQLHAWVMTDFLGGVCVRSIKKRTGLSQSTISNFMSILEDAGLVESRKIDQYTYFRRNEKILKEITGWMNSIL
ncbi:helix-turn-helix domain-containing protein [Clostridium sp. SHJSY1]|uniref:ArsR/SmtB family transcription factor n=1 Tax=Clostridium sp. SHJSY1 TaxID=2942483 RepID=UPI002876036E|nr:metalloregulator ArsR/SmtB family transcription factor [Clostridium sp. SHJSY1]MDS0524296.1 helix-turn-helix domain-containing protein [Clostridium sp. SHJSY1]